ncbi:MAG TPA: CoA-binding protein [Terriglobales bacterium]|nr:CoA-binding protein [Terriglobales bacterium]
MPTTLDDVRDFLAQRRIALVGLSRNPKDFSHVVFHEMSQRGYDMVPVNPAASELENRRCFAHLPEITPPVDGVLIMTAPRDTDRVVRDCAEAGVRRVWMHRGGGQGAVSKEAAEFCRQNGIRLVEGYCPLMFLAGTPFFHRVHGLFMKVLGGYPARGDAAAHIA